MKVITEAMLRDELRNSQPAHYCTPEGALLSPAAREYLQQRKIKIVKELPAQTQTYQDYETGVCYAEKPEHMCHLHGNLLVPKNHSRILFRGKLDSVQTMVVLDQALMTETGVPGKLIDDLGSVLAALYSVMKCDVLDQPLESSLIIGLTHRELRERSHDPLKFYGIKQMMTPDHAMGIPYARLNRLRAAIREVETAAVSAFCQNGKCSRSDIVEELNRLSSALHIMMCKWLAGQYSRGE